jgi:hypothetical protein
MTWPVSRLMRVSSSDSRRQPRFTSAAHSVLFPEPGRRRQDGRALAAGDRRRVEHQNVLTVSGDAPVETPFQHRQRLGAGQRGERLDGESTGEQRLGAQPAPQAASGLDGDVEVGEGRELATSV